MDASIETLASSAIAAGCLQAVMNMIHPELAKFVAFQKERVAQSDARQSFQRVTNTPDLTNLSPEQQTDISFQLKYLRQHWHSHLKFFGINPELPGVVQRALTYRNKVSHQSHMTLAQYEAAIATFEKLADMIECNSSIRQQINELVMKLLPSSPLKKQAAEAQINTKAVENIEARRQDLTQDSVVMPPTASLDQILQHNYLYDDKYDSLWMDFKLIGNDYFNEGNYTEAIEAYSQGLQVAPNKAVLYGNRATCFLRLQMFRHAREDAENALDADDYKNVKYYRLLSETMLAMKEYEEAKDICDRGLELEPNDAILRSRRRTLETKINEEKVAYEKEKKKMERDERAKVEAAIAAAKCDREEVSIKDKASRKKKGYESPNAKIELVAMINYQAVPANWIEVHTRGTQKFDVYKQGLTSLVVAADALLRVTDSIGMSGRSNLPLNLWVQEGIVNLRKAGEAGVAEAWYRLGVLYSSRVREGLPLTPDPHKMIECFQRAASLRPFIKPPGRRVFPHQGVAEAENELGVCHRDGISATNVKANLEKAFVFFLRSAEHDYPVGQYNVAIAYSTGKGIPVDAFAARLWTSRAAQHGLPEAQQLLAQLLKQGHGGKGDESQVRKSALTADQNLLANLLMSPDFDKLGATAFEDGVIADMSASSLTTSQRGKHVFKEFYDAYLEDKNDAKTAVDVSVHTDDEKARIMMMDSYTANPASSTNHNICRPPSTVIVAEIQARAKNGGITACNYVVSEKLFHNAEVLLGNGDVKGALRDLKKADLLWERSKDIVITTQFLSKLVKEAAVSFRINPRDIDAAYAIGRWGTLNDQDTLSHWKRCVKLHPNEASFHFYLGMAYLTFRRFEDAIDSMEAALAIDKKPDWLFWCAFSMIGCGMLDLALSVYKEYVNTNAPDERFIPDAYYSIGALYLNKSDNAMAVVYHELGKIAESVTIRFPAFYPRVLIETPKDTLRFGMKKSGYMESSVIASVMAQNMLECGFCKTSIKPTQLLGHKLAKCPRRIVSCRDCDEHLVFDLLQAHRQPRHSGVSDGKKKNKSKNCIQADTASQVDTAMCAECSQSNDLQQLTVSKFHLLASILKITEGKKNSTVFSLRAIIGHKWTLRMSHCSPKSSACCHVIKAIEGAEVDDSLIVFWCRPPSLESIDRRTLAIPMKGEVYGQDVVVYVLKCSTQALNFEMSHLRYMKDKTLCAGCGNPPYFNKRLLACSACKMVEYCSRDCQRAHWKRIHRHMCKHTSLFRLASVFCA
ncbi:putative Zinc finger, MYND-type, tetratricopeptide-like helical domain superfamily [Plasmopara halstedii]